MFILYFDWLFISFMDYSYLKFASRDNIFLFMNNIKIDIQFQRNPNKKLSIIIKNSQSDLFSHNRTV